LQATLRVSDLHGFSGQGAYTWSHSFDEVTAYRGALPQDSTNFKGDYGPSDFDSRNIVVGLLSYNVPGTQKLSLLSKGWQVNSLLSFHSGSPFSVYSSADTSGTNDENQRANYVPGVNPYAGFKQEKVNANWLNPAAFVDAAPGTFGDTSEMAMSVQGTQKSTSPSLRTPQSLRESALSSAWKCLTCSIARTLLPL
jgi:hypothetical protein